MVKGTAGRPPEERHEGSRTCRKAPSATLGLLSTTIHSLVRAASVLNSFAHPPELHGRVWGQESEEGGDLPFLLSSLVGDTDEQVALEAL